MNVQLQQLKEPVVVEDVITAVDVRTVPDPKGNMGYGCKIELTTEHGATIELTLTTHARESLACAMSTVL